MNKKTKISVILVVIFIVCLPITSILIKNTITDIQDELVSLNNLETSGRTSYTNEWLEDSEFDDPNAWNIRIASESPLPDVLGAIGSGQGNMKVIGEQHVYNESWDFTNATEREEWEVDTRPKWAYSTPNINASQVYPQSFGNDSRGLWASHEWEEGADQIAVVNWNNTIELPHDMSDYNITSASLRATFNASVQITEANNGIDVLSDPTSYSQTGDFARFFVLISDPEYINHNEAAFNQTSELGRDSPPYGEITDGVITGKDDLIEYINRALEYDFRNITLSVGIYIKCEDNWPTDYDYWDLLSIKGLDFSFNYEKRIDKGTIIEFNQEGEDISGDNIDITGASLKFEYQLNKNWTEKSEFSQIKILINNNSFGDPIFLSEYNSEGFIPANPEGGFDLEDLIPINQNITLQLQLYLANTFYLTDNITVSIDKVSLVISYDVITPNVFYEEPWFNLAIFIGATAISIGFGTYLLLYYRIFRFPKAIRKIRKYKRSLKKDKYPRTSVEARKASFKGQLKGNYKKLLFVAMIIISGFLVITLFQDNLSYSNQTADYTNNLKTSGRISYSKNWLSDSQFNDAEAWSISIESESPLPDAVGSINNNQGNMEIIGENYIFNKSWDFTKAENRSDWVLDSSPKWAYYAPNINPDDILPDLYDAQGNSSGLCLSHYWGDDDETAADQIAIINWNHTINLDQNMADYEITSASLSASFNGSVQTTPSTNTYSGAIDVLSDSDQSTAFQSQTGDFARFFVLISDTDDIYFTETAYNQTTKLGQDSPEIKNITGVMIADSEEKLINYLTKAISRNNRNFTLSVGMYVKCEDSFQFDADNWKLLSFTGLNFSFGYEKKIDKGTTVEFSQEGDAISGDNVVITGGNLKFDYKIDKTWPNTSEFSHLKILINDNEYNEKVFLSEYDSSDLIPANPPGGFNLDNVPIPKGQNITLQIQLYLENDFDLTENITVSIDNVYLEISYYEITPNEIYEEPWFYPVLALVTSGIAIGLGTYLLLYYRIFRFPKQVRTIRKFKKSLNKKGLPNIDVDSRQASFMEKFKGQLGKTGGDIGPKGFK